MACDTHADALMGHLYGELTPREDAAFLEHARTCAACREELAALGGIPSTVQRAAPLPDPPEAISFRIMEAARAGLPAQAARTGGAAPVAEKAGILSWLLKPWAVGLSLAGAAAAGLLVVGTTTLRGPALPQAAKTAAPASPPADTAARLDHALATAEAPAPVEMAAVPAAERDGALPAKREAAAEPAPKAYKAQERALADKADAVDGVERRGAGTAGGRKQISLDGEAPAGRARQLKEEQSPAAADEDTPAALGGLAQAPAREEAKARKAAAPGWGILGEKNAEGGGGMQARNEEREPAAQAVRPYASAPAASPPPPRAEPEAAEKSAPVRKPAGPAWFGAPLTLPRAPANAESKGKADMDDAAGVAPAAPAQPAARAAPPAAVAGGAGNAPADALRLPDAVEESRRLEKKPVAAAIAKDMRTLRETDQFMRAQMEMAAAADLLASREYGRALEAFQRAAQQDISGQLAPSPRLGESTALSRMGRCQDALAVVMDVARTHPKAYARVDAMEEVAQCHERAGQKASADRVRAEMERVRKAAGAKMSTAEERASRAQVVTRMVQSNAQGLGMCVRAAERGGELPGAAGTWKVRMTLNARGEVEDAEARGPRNAPVLERCLVMLVRSRRYPPGPDAALPVDVPLVVKGNAPPAADAPPR